MAFEPWARWLLLGHAVLAIALSGAATHLLIVALKLWQRGTSAEKGIASGLARRVRIHGQTTAVLYGAGFVLGLLVYPTYRYHVRGLYFDRYAPWASNLFDMKENLAALGLPLAVALFSVTRRFDARSESPAIAVIAALSLGIFSVVLFSVLSGLWITCLKGV